jgi:hypothetical protein
MDAILITVLISLAVSLALGIFVVIKEPANKLNRAFALFALATAAWLAANFIFYLNNSGIFWSKATYALAPLVIAAAAVWIFLLCKKKLSHSFIVLLSISCGSAMAAPFIGDLILREPILLYGAEKDVTGPFFPLYSAYFVILEAYLLYVLIVAYRKSRNVLKMQIAYVLAGVAISGIAGTTVSAVLPLVGISSLSILDGPSMIFLLLFTTLAITRYHLFEIKVILSEFLVFLTALFLMFLPLLVPGAGLKALTATAFLVYLFFGYFLIKAMYEEQARKNRAERMVEGMEKFNELLEWNVKQRIKELEEKNIGLEKFYKLTVGREAKMAELKNKIKELEIKSKSKPD